MASLVVCFVALTMVAAGTYYIGQKKDEKTINVKKIAKVETTVDSENIEVKPECFRQRSYNRR